MKAMSIWIELVRIGNYIWTVTFLVKLLENSPIEKYTSLTKFLAWKARPGTTRDGIETKAETYSSISATNQHQLRQKMYQ